MTAAYSHVKFSQEQIDCICDSLQQRGDIKTLENFLAVYSSQTTMSSSSGGSSTTSNGGGSGSGSGNGGGGSHNGGDSSEQQQSEAVMRAKAYAAYESGNYR